jgi:hypothetical protein
MVYFLNGPSNKDISRLLRFHILPKNIIPIEKIPDIETTSSGNRSVAKAGAYMYNEEGHHELVDNMENDFVWVNINRKNGEFITLRSKNKIASSNKWGAYTYQDFNYLLKYLDITTKPIYHLTPSMQKKFEVDDSNKIDTIINDWVDDNIMNLKTAFFLQQLAGQRVFQNIIEEKIAPKDYYTWLGNKSVSSICNAIVRFNVPQVVQWHDEFTKERELLKDKYPMLSSPTLEQERNYVKMVDGQQNG